ncbi:MAG: glutathione S-transferase family protein [Marinibacterium sp.]
MKLYVFPPSPNSRKVLFANALMGLGIEEQVVDLQSGEQKSPAILGLNPNGRIPILEFDDGTSLWESNAIVNKMAAMAKSDLWPASDQRYDILRWQFWESCHWTPACSKFISRHLFGNETIDLDAAERDLRPFGEVLDNHLAGQEWLSGGAMTTADISVSAMLMYRDACRFPLSGLDHIARWMGAIEATDAWSALTPETAAA